MSKTILIVDDEKEITVVLCKFLSKEGFNILTATDGETALKAAKKHIPDLIVLDIMMPGMDGGDVMAGIAKDDELKNIPIILLTGLIADNESSVYNDESTTGRLIMSKSLDIREQVNTIKKVLNSAQHPA